MFALTVLLAVSCEEKSKDKSWITYYPDLVLEGDATIYVDKGSEFVDPGYTATLNGVDVSDQVVVTSNVNTSVSGVYTITYSITNEDGFSSSATRTVIVTDPNDAIEGVYDTDPDLCYRDNSGTTDNAYYATSWEILVFNNGDGTYSIDDLLGGYYYYGRNYGSAYAMEATVTIADDGTMGLVDSYVAGWGDSALGLDGAFDADTQTFTWDVEYVTYIFHVVMTKR